MRFILFVPANDFLRLFCFPSNFVLDFSSRLQKKYGPRVSIFFFLSFIEKPTVTKQKGKRKGFGAFIFSADSIDGRDVFRQCMPLQDNVLHSIFKKLREPRENVILIPARRVKQHCSFASMLNS